MAVNRIPTNHSEHDLLIIAALASDDLSGAELTRATTLTTVCAECAQLLADLRALSVATAALPAPRRTRDFRLTEADAARLRPRGWRRLLGSLAGARFSFTRPLALGLTTLGVAGLLLAAVPLPFAGGGAAAPVLSSVGAPVGGAGPQPAAAPTSAALLFDSSSAGTTESKAAPGASVTPAEDSAGRGTLGPTSAPSREPAGVAESGQPEAPRAVAMTPGEDQSRAEGPSPLVLLSGAFLLAGLGLLGLSWAARRLTA